jgi:hypothetical protein
MTTLPPQLRENLSRAGSPARWFRPSAAGESVRPEVVETLLQGVVLTPELVPVVVREARPEGPTRRKALEIALRQRATPLVTQTAPVLPVNEASTDPFAAIGGPPMQATLPPATSPLNGHGRTVALITPPSGAASQDELVSGWLKRHGLRVDERLAVGVRPRICAETGLTDPTVRATLCRLRKQAGKNLGRKRGAPRTAATNLQKSAPTPPPAVVATVPDVDLGSPEAQARALVVSVCARLLAGDRDETLLLCSRLLDRAL